MEFIMPRMFQRRFVSVAVAVEEGDGGGYRSEEFQRAQREGRDGWI
jgi:hypothetical protein